MLDLGICVECGGQLQLSKKFLKAWKDKNSLKSLMRAINKYDLTMDEMIKITLMVADTKGLLGQIDTI